MPFSGSCLCGKTTYTVDADKPEIVGKDHCEDCQKQSGSAYSLVAVFHKSAVKISGPVKEYTSKGDSGKNVTRSFCSECGSPIAHDPEAAPEIIAIKVGTLDKDQKKNLKPEHDIYGP